MARVFGCLAWLLLVVAARGEQQQPLPYSHKLHVGLGLTCATCHKNPDPGGAMGFPAESLCMSCHRTTKVESPHIQKLAAAAGEKKRMEWVRVYQIRDFVYFSHRRHMKAGVGCETCHGPVKERDVISAEVVHNMQSCMACHKAMSARNECDACHEEK